MIIRVLTRRFKEKGDWLVEDERELVFDSRDYREKFGIATAFVVQRVRRGDDLIDEPTTYVDERTFYKLEDAKFYVKHKRIMNEDYALRIVERFEVSGEKVIYA